MSYTKTTWVANQAPAITAANLNNIENGIENAHEAIGIQGTVYNIMYKTADEIIFHDGVLGLNCEPATVEVDVNNLPYVKIQGTSIEQYVQMNTGFKLPFDYKEGTDLKFFLNMITPAAVTTSQTHGLGLSVGYYKNLINATSGKGTISSNAFGTNTTLLLLNLTDAYNTQYANVIANSNFVAGNTILPIRLLRNTMAMTYTGDIHLYSIGIIYEVDGNGSTSQTSKVKTW